MEVTMTEKRMAGEYEIVQAISVGSEEIVLGYAPHNESLPYMTAFCAQNELFALPISLQMTAIPIFWAFSLSA